MWGHQATEKTHLILERDEIRLAVRIYSKTEDNDVKICWKPKPSRILKKGSTTNTAIVYGCIICYSINIVINFHLSILFINIYIVIFDI